MLAADTCRATDDGLDIDTAIGVSVAVTFMVFFSMGVLVASVLCYISRSPKMSSFQPRLHGDGDFATVYDEEGTNKNMKCDAIEMDANTAYGYHVAHSQ